MPSPLVEELRSLIFQSYRLPQPTWLFYLVPVLPKQLFPQAIRIAALIMDRPLRTSILTRLLARLSQEERETLLEEALLMVQEIKIPLIMATALIGFAPCLSTPLLLEEALEVLKEALEAKRTQYPEEAALVGVWVEDMALLPFVPYLPERAKRKVVQKVLKAVRAIGNEEHRAQTILGLLPYLPERAKRKVALEAVKAIGTQSAEQSAWVAALVGVWVEDMALLPFVPYLPERAKRKAVLEALEAVRAIGNEESRAQTILGLLPLLPYLSERAKRKVVPEVLEAVRAIGNEEHRAGVLLSLLPYLPERAKRKAVLEVLEAVRVLGNEEYRAQTILGLLPPELNLLPPELGRAYLFLRAALFLPERAKRKVALEAMRTWETRQESGSKYEDEGYQIETFLSPDPHLAERAKHEEVKETLEVTQALEAMQAIKRVKDQASTLIKQAAHPSGSLLQEKLQKTFGALLTLEALQEIEDLADRGLVLEYRVSVLIELASYLSEQAKHEWLQKELNSARVIKDATYRASALMTLAPLLPEWEKREVLQEALNTARTIERAEYRAVILLALVPLLPDQARHELLYDALKAVRAIEDVAYRASALMTLAPLLPEWEKREVLQEAHGTMEAAQAIEKVGDRAEGLESRASALIKLASYLPEQAKHEAELAALETALSVEDAERRSSVLAMLAPQRLPELLFQRQLRAALTIAWTIEYPEFRSQFLLSQAMSLTRLASYLPEQSRKRAEQEALAFVRAIGELEDWGVTPGVSSVGPNLSFFYLFRHAGALMELIPLLSEQSKQAAEQEALDILQKVGAIGSIGNIYSGIVPWSSPIVLGNPFSPLSRQALRIVRAFKDAKYRVEAALVLVPYLSDQAKHEVLQEALKATQAIGRVEDQVEALIKLAPYLSELLQEALEIAWAIEDEGYRAWVLAALAPLQETPGNLADILSSLELHEVPAGLGVRIFGLLVQIAEDERYTLLEEVLYALYRPFFWIQGQGVAGNLLDEYPEKRPYPNERVVNTGFASKDQADIELDSRETLTCNQTFYFWLEVGPPLEGAIDEENTPLPPLPGEARLKVALFALTEDIEIPLGADIGELQIQDNGAVRVVRQPDVPASIPVDSDLLRRRLFFPVQTPDHPGIISLLCNIYYEQILIQSRLVQAHTMPYPQALDWALRSVVIYTLASTISPSHLKRMATQKLSIIFTSNTDDTLNFCLFGANGRELLKQDILRDGQQVQNLIELTRRTLRKAAWGKEGDWRGEAYRYAGPYSQERLQEDLFRFAICGYRIFDEIVGGIAGGNYDIAKKLVRLMREPGQVQIAVKQSPRFVPPVALMYDYPLDTDALFTSYTLCPVFIEALKNHTPLEDLDCFKGACPSLDPDRGTVVCPGGFWGFRHSLGMPLSVGPGLDVPGEIVYQDVLQWLVSFTTDKKLRMREDHIRRMKLLWPKPKWDDADTRDKTFAFFKTLSPHLIYFYCHGGVSESGLPYIQVGQEDERGITRANLRLLETKWGNTRPLVFINGCHTTALEPEKVMELVSAFVGHAAAGVIGTEINVFEPLACTFAEECLRYFLQGMPIGEAVRKARLTLLQMGNPLGLAYIPFVLPSLHLRNEES